MAGVKARPLDYVLARLRGRHGRMMVGSRLAAACRSASVRDLARAVAGGVSTDLAEDLERRLVEDLVREHGWILEQLDGVAAWLVGWMLARFQVENFKVWVRGISAGASPAEIERHVVALPDWLTGGRRVPAAGVSLEGLGGQAPEGAVGDVLREAARACQSERRPFLWEAAMDRAYLRVLIGRSRAAGGADREPVSALVRQEADLFLLRLALRGRLLHRLPAEALLPWHVPGGRFDARGFVAVVQTPEAPPAQRAMGRIVEGAPAAPAPARGEGADVARWVAAWEQAGRRRLRRCAERAFRTTISGVGGLVGYLALRRLEVADLGTLAEGIRLGRSASELGRRLGSEASPEEDHVAA